MGLFSRAKADPCEMLDATLIGYRTVWGMFDALPPAQQRKTLESVPADLRDRVRAAAQLDLPRTKTIIAAAQADPPSSGPAQLPWDALIRHAIA